MNKYLFLDLDETLIHSVEFTPGSNRVLIELENAPSGGWSIGSTEKYGVLLRPDTDKFLRIVREKYPNVYMLTAATYDYASAMNRTFNLGFKEDQIYAREHWTDIYFHRFTDDPAKSVLVDNQYRDERNAKDKINYLSVFGPAEYVRIRPFYGHNNGAFTDKLIQETISNIDRAFEILDNPKEIKVDC